MDLLQKCKQIYEAVRYFSYGIPVDGKIQDVSGEEFAKNYRFLSPQEFVDLEGGVCWDYVEYERTCCENYGLKYHQYYIITNTPPNYDTHTFITVEDGDELIYIESSFKKVEHIIDGVKKFKSLEEIVNLITTTMFSCNDNDKNFEEFKYDVMEYHGHPAYGCSCEEYMNWMNENGEIALQGTAINPKNIDADELNVEEMVIPKYHTYEDPEEYDETLHDHIDDEDDVYNEASVLKFPKKVNNVPFDIMYFGSNIDFGNESIKLDHNELFLTPYIGLASIFITDRKEYFKPLPKDRPHNTNIGYDEWGLSPSELQKPLKEVHVSLDDIPNVTPFEFDYTGYIYAIDVSQYKNNLYQKDWMTSDREFILKDINPVPIKEKIKWTHHVYVRGKKNTDDVHNESAQETVQRGRNLADPDGVMPGSEKSKEELEQELAKYIKTINESWTDFKNGVHPSSGLMFHVSLKNDMDGKTINPQLPSYITDGGELDDNYQEDTTTKRLCVSPSIEGCLIAILNYNKIREHVGDKFYVYTPEKPFSQYKHKTNKEIVKDKLVFDANITKEAWILEPCKLKLYGIIKLKKVKDLKKKPTVEKNIKMNTIKLDYEWIMTPKASGKFNKAIGDSPDKEDDTKEKPIKEYDNILVSNDEFFMEASNIQEGFVDRTIKHTLSGLKIPKLQPVDEKYLMDHKADYMKLKKSNYFDFHRPTFEKFCGENWKELKDNLLNLFLHMGYAKDYNIYNKYRLFLCKLLDLPTDCAISINLMGKGMGNLFLNSKEDAEGIRLNPTDVLYHTSYVKGLTELHPSFVSRNQVSPFDDGKNLLSVEVLYPSPRVYVSLNDIITRGGFSGPGAVEKDPGLRVYKITNFKGKVKTDKELRGGPARYIETKSPVKVVDVTDEFTKTKEIKESCLIMDNDEFFGLSMIQESHKNITKHSFKSLTKKGIAVDRDSETGKLVKKVIDNVLKNHSLPSVKLNPSGFGVAKETDTFFYGYPRYIDGEIPTDSKGKQLRFMAQINCKELKSLPDYPHTGLLQFWVHGDSEILNGPVKAIYIEKPNKNNIANVSLDEALYSYKDPGDFPYISINGYNHSDNLLFKSTTKEMIGPNITDLNVLYDIFSEEYKKLTGKKADISALVDYIWDDDRLQPSWGNRVGGYPSSTQETSSKRTKSWNTMLLQLESIDREVYWGDFGIAAFYISRDDLIKKDFSKVGFDWDCY